MAVRAWQPRSLSHRFFLPPLLVLLVLITGTVMETSTVEKVLQGQIGGPSGRKGRRRYKV